LFLSLHARYSRRKGKKENQVVVVEANTQVAKCHISNQWLYIHIPVICSKAMLLTQASSCIALHALFLFRTVEECSPIIYLPQIWVPQGFHPVANGFVSDSGQPHIKPAVGHYCILALSSGTNNTKTSEQCYAPVIQRIPNCL